MLVELKAIRLRSALPLRLTAKTVTDQLSSSKLYTLSATTHNLSYKPIAIKLYLSQAARDIYKRYRIYTLLTYLYI